MKKFEEYIFLSDKWDFIKVSDRNHKTHFRYKDFYLTPGKKVSKEDQETFDMYRNLYNHNYSVLKTLLNHGITSICLKGKYEDIQVKEGKLKIDLTSLDIEKHMEDFLKSSGENYNKDREKFLEDMISRKKTAYLFTESLYTTSYEMILSHGCSFHLMKDRAHLLGINEEEFILESIPKILSLTNSYVEENHSLQHKKNETYYSSTMGNNDIDIRVCKISDKGMERLHDIVEKHNERIENLSKNKKLVLGGE